LTWKIGKEGKESLERLGERGLIKKRKGRLRNQGSKKKTEERKEEEGSKITKTRPLMSRKPTKNT